MDYQLELSENDMCMSKDGFRVHGLMLIDEVIYTSSKSSVMMRVFFTPFNEFSSRVVVVDVRAFLTESYLMGQ